MITEEINKKSNCLKYKGKWLTAQKNLLETIEKCILEPRHNIVVPSAFDRYDISLEILSRYNSKALIVTDNFTTRSFWRSKIFSDFLDSDLKDEVSTNLRLPKYITIVTYQTLLNSFLGQTAEFDMYRNKAREISPLPKIREDKAKDIIEILKNNQIETVIFDEPQYQSDEIWRTIEFLTDYYPFVHQLTVSENNPADLPYNKLKKYDELFGRTSAAITLQDLIKTNIFTPYCDFVYFVKPTEEENALISEHKTRLGCFLPFIVNNMDLIQKLYSSPFIQKSEKHAELILRFPMFFISVASLFKSNNILIPDSLMELLDADDSDIPDFRLNEAECFINGLIKINSYFPDIDRYFQEIKKALIKYQFFKDNVVSLDFSQNLQDSLYSTTNKSHAIKEITRHELVSLQEDLRLLVVTAQSDENSTIQALLSVDEIFTKKYNAALISESLILLPENLAESFYEILKSKYINKDNIVVTPYPGVTGYLKIQTKDSLKNSLCRAINKMFFRGEIKAIVTTDVMFSEDNELNNVNTLIFALPQNNKTVFKYRSQCMKYNSSDQERILRIFHICCLFEQNTDDVFINNSSQKGSTQKFSLSSLKDFENICSRFCAIEGVSLSKHEFQNSIELILPPNYSLQSSGDLMSLNDFQLQNSDNKTIKSNWNIAKNKMATLSKKYTEGLETNNLPDILPFQIRYYYFFIIISLLFFTTIYFIPKLFIFALTISLCTMLYPVLKMFTTSTPEKIIRCTGNILIKCLYLQGNIDTKPNDVQIKVETLYNGNKFVYSPDLTEKENRIFVKSMKDFFSEIKNPTYLLMVKNSYFGFIEKKEYYALPEIFAENKQLVLKFKSLWKEKLCNCKIYYTGNDDCKYILLRTRKNIFGFLKDKTTKITRKYV